MSRRSGSPGGSADQPLRLFARPDLQAQPQVYRGERCWMVKDPVALRYFRFQEEEYALLRMLDGRTSLEEIRARFERGFAPQEISLAELQQFFGNLHRSSLVVADTPGQGATLIARREQQVRRRFIAAGANLLAFRLPGVNARPVLDVLLRWVGWVFSLPAVLAGLLLIAAAGLLVAVEFDTFHARLPTWQEFFGPGNWWLLVLTLSGTKVLHELGHGLSCRRLGGDCHEMGVMFLAFAPCLYCDVTDSWMMPDKWRRAAIGAAGMYVELWLAAVCTFLWWFSQPGTLHYLCLNVMFVCSVSTLLINANPLLRYDGYYILSDVLEIPNLRQRAATVWQRTLAAVCLGLTLPPDPFLPRRGQALFLLYAVAALVYRWLITVSILCFLWYVLEPHGLQVLGQLVAIGTIAGMAAPPLIRLAQFLSWPGRTSRMNARRLVGSLAVVTGAVAVVCLLPLPHNVRCSLYVEPRGAAAVYAPVLGSLVAIHARPGDVLDTGQPLAALRNLDLEVEVLALRSRRESLAARHAQLQRRALRDDRAALELEQLAGTLNAIDDQYRQRSQELERLALRAPRAGVLLAVPRRSRRKTGNELPVWDGRPLETRNCGAWLTETEAVGWVGDPHALSAVLIVDQRDIELIAEGQPVELFLTCRPGQGIAAKLDRVSRRAMQAVPASLAVRFGGPLSTLTDELGLERPHATVYQASAALDDPDSVIVPGVTGKARILAGHRTIAQRLWRLACQTFGLGV